MTTAIETAPGMGSGIVSPGHVLGRYELLMPVAAGGMAMVWAARLRGTRGFQKIVAVKTMLPKLSDDIQFEQMFLDEASLASQIRHPHVVEILDLGEQEGVLFLVMEWIDGMPLNQIMKAAKLAGGMPLPIAVRIVMQACAGLHAVHELRNAENQLVGLVHRDVSPQNILVTYDGVTKVVDFGVAKATALGGGTTSAGQIKGKVGYMAPEQIEGENIDRRADVFAIGIVLYALTTGKHPFRRESDAATMYYICSPQPVLPPRKFLASYPASLERVLLRALAKSPADRYASANEMLRDLDQSLPADERAITDEEVAQFIRKLVGDKLQERRGTLSDALARADQNSALRQVGGTPPTPSAPTTKSGLFAQTLLPTSASSATATALSPFQRHRRLGTMVGGLLVAGGVGAAIVWLARPSAKPEQLSPVTAAPAASVLMPSPINANPPEPSAPPVLTPDVAPPPEVAKAPSAKPEASRAPQMAPPVAAPPIQQHPPPGAPPKKPNWRHDPGF